MDVDAQNPMAPPPSGPRGRKDLRIPFGERGRPQPIEKPLRILFVGDYLGRPDPRPIEDRNAMRLTPTAQADCGAAEVVGRRWEALLAFAATMPDGVATIDLLPATADDLLFDFEDALDTARSGLSRALDTGELGSVGGRPFAAVVLDDEVAHHPGAPGLIASILEVCERVHVPLLIPPGTTPPLPSAVTVPRRCLRKTDPLPAIRAMVDAFQEHGLCSTADAGLVDAQLARCLMLVARGRQSDWHRQGDAALHAMLQTWVAERTGDHPSAVFLEASIRVEPSIDRVSPPALERYVHFALEYVPHAPLPRERRVVSGAIARE